MRVWRWVRGFSRWLGVSALGRAAVRDGWSSEKLAYSLDAGEDMDG